MACYRPVPAFQGGQGATLQLWPPLGTENLKIPCGKCLGCRSDRALAWASRSEQEASRWKHNIFLTLTYDDDHEPRGGHLAPEDLTRFLKRLRTDRERNRHHHKQTQPKLRYLACGEYGERRGRPHYHAILYDCDFMDRTRRSSVLYSSETLTALWGNGLALYGDADGGAAAYIAAYALKAVWKHWNTNEGYADEYGEWHPKPQPYFRVSTRPPIGATWLQANATDLQHGYLIKRDGRRTKVPRTYLNRLEREEQLHGPSQYNIPRPEGSGLTEQIKYTQWKATILQRQNLTDARLLAMEEIHERRKQLLDNPKL